MELLGFVGNVLVFIGHTVPVYSVNQLKKANFCGNADGVLSVVESDR